MSRENNVEGISIFDEDLLDAICHETKDDNDNVILLVDDELDNLITLSDVLGKKFKVLTADSAAKAMGLIKETNDSEPIKLILCDQRMPELTGVEFLEKTIPLIPRARRILLTGFTDVEVIIESVNRAQIHKFMIKPVEPDYLLLTLQRAIEGYNLESENLQLVENLREEKENAERANKAKSEFLSNISHELRTPLHAILSFSSFGIEKYEFQNRIKLLKYFERIKDSGNTLLSLLNDLLDLAKLEAGKMVFDFQLENLVPYCDQVIDEFSSALSTKNISLTFPEPTGTIVAVFDSKRIRQVIRNLISNAVKFSPDKGTIEVSIDEEKAHVCLSVLDQGIGIPEAEFGAVFEKFVQSSKTKTGAGGTGLGLSICLEIIEAHGGDIWAANNPKGGAVFSFRIPKSAEDQR